MPRFSDFCSIKISKSFASSGWSMGKQHPHNLGVYWNCGISGSSYLIQVCILTRFPGYFYAYRIWESPSYPFSQKFSASSVFLQDLGLMHMKTAVLGKREDSWSPESSLYHSEYRHIQNLRQCVTHKGSLTDSCDYYYCCGQFCLLLLFLVGCSYLDH